MTYDYVIYCGPLRSRTFRNKLTVRPSLPSSVSRPVRDKWKSFLKGLRGRGQGVGSQNVFVVYEFHFLVWGSVRVCFTCVGSESLLPPL